MAWDALPAVGWRSPRAPPRHVPFPAATSAAGARGRRRHPRARGGAHHPASLFPSPIPMHCQCLATAAFRLRRTPLLALSRGNNISAAPPRPRQPPPTPHALFASGVG
nr:unnamed protein product [Digitaria exilis]